MSNTAAADAPVAVFVGQGRKVHRAYLAHNGQASTACGAERRGLGVTYTRRTDKPVDCLACAPSSAAVEAATAVEAAPAKAPTLKGSSITRRLRRAGVPTVDAAELDRTYPTVDGVIVERVGRVIVSLATVYRGEDGRTAYRDAVALRAQAAEVLTAAGFVVVDGAYRGDVVVTLADRADELEARADRIRGHAFAPSAIDDRADCALCHECDAHSIHEAGRLRTIAEACRAAATAATAVELEPAAAVDEVLEARRQAEAPAPALPGVDAAIVEASLAGHPDDDAASMAAPTAPRVWVRGTVHLASGQAAVCGSSLVGGIDTEAPLSCARCVGRHLEAEGMAPAAAAEAAVDALAGAGEPAVDELVVIPCGGTKLDHAAPAGELYRGSLHRSARLAADALAARRGAHVAILSALYGVLELDRVVDPYDVTIGDEGAIDAVGVALQLSAAGVTRVVALTPGRYTDLLRQACRAAGIELVAPLAGSRGVLEQRGRLRRLRTGELALAA